MSVDEEEEEDGGVCLPNYFSVEYFELAKTRNEENLGFLTATCEGHTGSVRVHCLGLGVSLKGGSGITLSRDHVTVIT